MPAFRCPSCGFSYGLKPRPEGGWICRHCGWGGSNLFSMEGDDVSTSIPWDVVTLRIKAHKQVQSETVRVFVTGNLLAAGDDTGKTKAVLGAALSKVIDAPWALTTARRDEDSSGMERVSIAASVRVKEHLTAGLVERLKQASRAGLQLHLDRIVTRPPRLEMDKVIENLRHEVYQQAKAEAETLNTLLPAEEGKWRIASIEFGEINEQSERTREMRERMEMSSSQFMAAKAKDEAEPGLPVMTRAVLEAQVQLKRLSIAPPERGFFAER